MLSSVPRVHEAHSANVTRERTLSGVFAATVQDEAAREGEALVTVRAFEALCHF